MGVNSIGIITKKVETSEIAKFIGEMMEVRDLVVKDNTFIEFYYFSDMKDFDKEDVPLDDYEERALTASYYTIDEDLKEMCSEYNMDISKFDDGYTYIYLGSWGSSNILIYKVIKEFGEGYLIPIDYKKTRYFIDKNTTVNDSDIDFCEVAYKDYY